MKKRIPSFLSGFLTAALLLALTTTALAASGEVTFSFANIALDGETKMAAGATITAANGQQVPGSILYTDAAGGKTNYLPIRAICDLLKVEIGYDSATQTVLLTSPGAKAHWTKSVEDGSVTYTSEKSGKTHDAPLTWYPGWLPEGMGMESVSGGSRVSQRYTGGGNLLWFQCAYPDGGSFGWGGASEEAVQTCRQLTVQGYPAEFYTDGERSLLTWQNEEGVLFWFTGRGLDEGTLAKVAESVTIQTQEVPTFEMNWLPEGYTAFDSAVTADTAYEVWMKDGMGLTWLYSAGSVAVPDGTPRTVAMDGGTARFWAAREPYQKESGSMTVNGQPVEGSSATVSGVTISSGTIPGVNSDDVNILLWTREGITFRLQSVLDRDTMIRIAENVALKK